jgi:hypothetical protein
MYYLLKTNGKMYEKLKHWISVYAYANSVSFERASEPCWAYSMRQPDYHPQQQEHLEPHGEGEQEQQRRGLPRDLHLPGGQHVQGGLVLPQGVGGTTCVLLPREDISELTGGVMLLEGLLGEGRDVGAFHELVRPQPLDVR